MCIYYAIFTLKMSRKRTLSLSNESSSNESSSNELLNLLKAEIPPPYEQDRVILPAGDLCDFRKIKVGNVLSRNANLEILEVNDTNVKVRNQEMHKAGLEGSDWTLANLLVKRQCRTANQFSEEQQKTMTELAAIVNNLGDSIVEIGFTKEPDLAASAKLIRDGAKLIEESGKSEAEKTKLFKKLYERSQEGEFRVIRGHPARSENLEIQGTDTGMVKFIDAELVAQDKFALRLVNLRKLKYVNVNGVRYTLKKQ